MIKIISLIALLYVVSGVIVHDNPTGSSANLATYIKYLLTKVTPSQEGDNLVVEYLHPIPDNSIEGFSMLPYLVDATNKDRVIEALQHSKKTDNYFVGIRTHFPAVRVVNGGGCVDHTTVTLNEWFIKRCQIKIEYINQKQDEIIKNYYSNIIVWIPRSGEGDYEVNVQPIYEKSMCECEIIPDLVYEASIFRENCITPIESGGIVTYGDYICLFIKGVSELIGEFYLEPASLYVTFLKSNGESVRELIMGTVTYKTDLVNGRTRNQLYAIVPVYYSGKIKYELTTILNKNRRLLAEEDEGKGFTSIIEFDTEGKSENEGIDSFSANIFVSALTFLAMLMVIL